MDPQGTTELDAEGNSVLTLERKSVQPFRTQDEYLYAMKEDLAEWFNTLYNCQMDAEDFFDQLETGVRLCEHANNVNDFIQQNVKDPPGEPQRRIQYRATNVCPGSFQCRDNISNFITWCRWILSIPDTLLFESDDLVMRKNERNVVLCVLEVARRGARYGMLAPILVQMEVEIDAEIAGEEPPPPPPQQPPRQRRTIDMMSLDEMVRDIAKQCTCPDQFPIVRISEGKYKVGESQTLIFVRILRNHVMVRIGGGWDTLENYLNRHDPCRCNAAKSHKHPHRRGGTQSVQPTNRRASVPSAPSLQGFEVTRSRQLPTTPAASEDRDLPKRSQSVRRSSTVTPRVGQLRKSDDYSSSQNSSGSRPQSPVSARRPQSPVSARRPQSPALINAHKRPQSPIVKPKRPASPALSRKSSTVTEPKRERRHSLTSGAIYKQFTSDASSSQPVTFNKPDPVKPQPKRPQSAGPGSHSKTLSRESSFSRPAVRSRSPARTESQQSPRSRSVGASELRKHLINKSVDFSNDFEGSDVLIVSRDKAGHHIVSADDTDLNSTMPATSGNTNGQERSLSSVRARIGTDKLLPSKPKTMMRSQSMETKAMSERQDSDESSGSSTSELNSGKVRIKRQTSVSSVGSVSSTIEETLADFPAPAADQHLNEHMERLFEEYRRIEKLYDDDEPKNTKKSSRTLPAAPANRSTRPGSAGPRKTSAPSQHATASRPSVRDSTGPQRQSSLSASSSSSSLSSSCYRVRPSTPTKSQNEFSPVNQRASSPSNPTAQRRSVTPVRPIPIRPTVSYGQPANTGNTPVSAKTSQVTRSSSVQRDRSQTRVRSQTPNPETNTPKVRTPARCKTPVIKLKTEDVKSRIDTGLRNRSTTPVSVSRTSSQRGSSSDIRRSSSLSRAAVNKHIGTDMGFTTPRSRSRSKEDLLDSDDLSERRSRSDVTRKRDLVQSNGTRSDSREVKAERRKGYPNGDIYVDESTFHGTPSGQGREPSRSLPPTPGMLCTAAPLEPVSIEIPDQTVLLPGVYPQNPQAYNATPRKDEKCGPRTRIPRPSSAQRDRIPGMEMNTLKRFDSGVDINISPTGTSINGDDDNCNPWPHQPEAAPLSPRNMAYAVTNYNETSDEYY